MNAPAAWPHPAASAENSPPADAQPLESHLAELRWRILASTAAVLVGSGLGWHWTPDLIAYIRGGLPLLIFVTPAEAFMTYVRVAVSAGIGLAMPVILWQAWRFVAPALFPHERRLALTLGPLAVFMYALGLGVGIEVVYPLSLKLFLGWAPHAAQPAISIARLWGFFLATTLPLGLIFQLPLGLAALASLGAVDRGQLREWRRLAVLASAVLAGMLAPTVPAQLLIGALIYLMYELGRGLVWLLRLGGR